MSDGGGKVVFFDVRSVGRSVFHEEGGMFVVYLR